MIIDYQEIINLISEFMKYALPIGLIFGISERLINLFFSLAFGNKNIKL